MRLASDPYFLEKQAISRRQLAHQERFRRSPNYPQLEIESNLREFFPELNLGPGDVVLDFGANEGWFSLSVGSSGATVVGFEPNFDAFVHAVERCRALPNVTMVNTAVGATTGQTDLYFPADYDWAPEIFSGSVSTMSQNVGIDATSHVSVFQLGVREIFDSFDEIYFLKVDIEGGEQDIWGVIQENLHKIKYLAIETHERLVPGAKHFVSSAQKFINENNLGDRWMLDWP